MKEMVIIPAYNECRNIEFVLKKTLNYTNNIIVIDDGSSDNTFDVVKKVKAENPNKNITALKHKINLGKGATMITGCEAAKRLNAEIIICMDADNQHNPEDILKFINKINAGNDIVFGSRIIGKSMPLARFIGNKFLSAIICKFFKILIHDTQSGYRAFTTKTYDKIKWESSDYAVETEMIVKTAKNKLKYCEIEIETVYLDSYKGVTPITGLLILFKILKWKLL